MTETRESLFLKCEKLLQDRVDAGMTEEQYESESDKLHLMSKEQLSRWLRRQNESS